MIPRECIHDMPIIKIGDHDRCAMCRHALQRDPSLRVESLLKPVPNEQRAEGREVAARGLAAARAGIRQARYTQEPLT